jgi:hypothetical protein
MEKDPPASASFANSGFTRKLLQLVLWGRRRTVFLSLRLFIRGHLCPVRNGSRGPLNFLLGS